MNHNIYEENLAIIGKNVRDIDDKKKFLDSLEGVSENIRINGNNGIEFFEQGRFFKVSGINIDDEIERMTKNIQEKKDYLIIIFGIGHIALLKRIMSMISEGTRILIYEPNAYMVKYILEHEDMSFLFDTGQAVIKFEFGDKKRFEEETQDLVTMKWHNLLKNIRIIAPPNMWCYKDKCFLVLKKITEILKFGVIVLGNSLEDVFNGQENSYKNVDAVLESNKLSEIKDKFKGYPAIIVASGPSLDKNIDILSEAQDKALIITCDASLEACKKHGVRPDAIASIERDIPTYQYYYQGKEFDKDLVLLGPVVLWPEIFETFHGKKIVTNKVDSGVEKWWADNFEGLEFLNQGHSSAHVAFACARYAGCNPIILIGQDLAYTNEKKHSDLTHTEFEGKNDSRESDGLMVEDIYGDMVPTDTIYNLFRKWIELQIVNTPGLTVIDATEGGAKIDGSKILTLRESIDTYCKKNMEYHMVDCLENKGDIGAEQYIEKYNQIIKEANKQIYRLKKLQKKAANYYKILNKLYNKNIMKMKEQELIGVLLKMQKGNKIIREIQEENFLITYFQQMIRQTIIFVKGLGNEITPENVIKNLQFQANLIYVIKDGCGVVEKEYRKMITFLEEKKKFREQEIEK